MLEWALPAGFSLQLENLGECRVPGLLVLPAKTLRTLGPQSPYCLWWRLSLQLLAGVFGDQDS